MAQFMNQALFFSTLLCLSCGKIRSLWLSQSNQQVTPGPLGHPNGRSPYYSHRSRAEEERGGVLLFERQKAGVPGTSLKGPVLRLRSQRLRTSFFLFLLAVRPADRSFQKPGAPSLTSCFLSSLKQSRH